MRLLKERLKDLMWGAPIVLLVVASMEFVDWVAEAGGFDGMKVLLAVILVILVAILGHGIRKEYENRKKEA